MIHLTIGYLSGVIAAIVFVLQFILPNALIVILVGLLKNKHTAVTWSVVERNLLSSHWPLFLRADSTASRGVDRSIRLLTWIRPLALLLITIAAVCTPLGLYDDVLPNRSTQPLRMVYVPDAGPFGFGTPPRDPQFFNRKCYKSQMPAQCPGTTDVVNTSVEIVDGEMLSGNASWDNIDMRIPKTLAKLYQSGLEAQPGSVSSFFDIQTRQYGYAQDNGYMHNKSYLTDGFQYLSTVILNEAIEPFEGLIVDTISGSIGFRNHTVPDGAGLGAEWSEDLLFIEPETQCVSMNVSLEFRVPMSDDYETLANITLVDDGGMTEFVQKYPLLDLTNAQQDPQLHNRAYKAGWTTNIYNMLTMNLTRPSPDAFGYLKSHVGARYPLARTQTHAQLNGIYISSLWDAILDPTPISNYTLADTPTANFSNPFQMGYSNFSDISLICSGAGGQDLTNLTNVHVECGLIFGAARRRDGTETLIFEPGRWYVQPLYSCASATKAAIKTVDFRYNATQEIGHTLKALSVLNVTPKTYKDQVSMPLWGVETVDYTLSDLSQLWGIIDPTQEHAVNLSTIRSPQLYLPGYSGFLSNSPRGLDNIPGANGPRNALYAIYQTSGMSSTGLPDYTGTLNYAMLAKWREYSKSHETMAKVMNLMWTDIAANYLMGTRSWNRASDWLPPNLQDPKYKKRQAQSESDEDGQTRIPVQVYQRKIRYHWYFAIPALASLLLVGLVVAGAFVLMVFGRGTPSRIDHYLIHLSSGRLLGSMQYPSEDKDAPTTEWITRVGRKQSDLHRLAAAYNREMATGLSPYFKQPTGYGDKGPPPASDYHTRPIPTGPMSSGGKGYVQVSTHEQQGDEIFGRAK